MLPNNAGMNYALLPPDSQMLIETVPALLSEAVGWKDTEIDFSRLALEVFRDVPGLSPQPTRAASSTHAAASRYRDAPPARPAMPQR